MSKTETENVTPWTASELAYRDQLVLAVMQGDWAADTSECITKLGLYAERAELYFRAAEAVLLERRKHGLAENKRTSIIWDEIPGGGSTVQPATGYGITEDHIANRDRNLTIHDFPPGTLLRYPGESELSWQLVQQVGPHKAILASNMPIPLSKLGIEELGSGFRFRRNEVILSHDGGKTWS